MNNRKHWATVATALALLLGWTCGCAQELFKGMKGDEVVELQARLNDLGYVIGVVDGDFGGKTEKAVQQFQLDHGLEETGIVDGATEQAMAADLLDRQTRRYEYYLGNYSWEEANARALAMGGHLVSITSAGEFAEIQSELLELGGAEMAFWIGARRDRNALESSKGFSWVDAQDRTLPEKVEALNGVLPWAVDQPTYKTEAGEWERYVRMRYSSEEARWVFEDDTGDTKEGTQTGYIVEYDERKGRAELKHSEVELLKPLAFGEEPEYRPGKAEGKADTILAVDMIDNYLYVKANAGTSARKATEECLIEFDYWRDDHGAFREENLVYDTRKWVYGELRGGWIRDQIPREIYRQMQEEPAGIVLETWIYYCDNVKNKVVREGSVYHAKLPLESEATAAESEVAEGTAGSVSRVTPVLASDATTRDKDRTVDIFAPGSENPVAQTCVGRAVYLEPGDYIARLDSDIESAFEVGSDACTISLDDCGPAVLEGAILDDETLTPKAGAEITLENQGRTYTVTTDENGRFRLEGLAPVKSIVYVAGNGVVPEVFGTLADLDGGGAVNHLDIPIKSTRHVEFLGRIHYDGAAWNAAYMDWLHEGGKTSDDWFIGNDSYFTVEEQLVKTAGKPIEAGTVYNLGANVPGRKVISTPSIDEFDDLPIGMRETGEDTGISDLVVVRAEAEKDLLRELNPTHDGFFDGWSEELIDPGKSEKVMICDPKTAYYHILLEEIREKRSPMGDPLFVALLERYYRECGLNDFQIRLITGFLSAVPKEKLKYQYLYLLALQYYSLKVNVDQVMLDGKPSGVAGYQRCLCKDWPNTVYITKNLSDGYFLTTFFHESGHAAEFSLVDPQNPVPQFAETEAALIDSIGEAVKREIRKHLDDYAYKEWAFAEPVACTEEEKELIVDALCSSTSRDNEEYLLRFFGNTDYRTVEALKDNPKLGIAYDLVRKKMEDKIEEMEKVIPVEHGDANMVTDMYRAVTNGKIDGKLNDAHNNYTNFWYTQDNNGKVIADLHRVSEAWAEYYSALLSQDWDNQRYNEEYLGKPLMAEMDFLATQMYNRYLEQAEGDYGSIQVNTYGEVEIPVR